MPGIYVTIQFHWHNDEPDGSECYACGDQCWLWMWRGIVKIGGDMPAQPSDYVLCEGCYQEVIRGDDDL